MASEITVRPVDGKADLKTFVDLAYRINADTPHWVPPLRSDVTELLTPGKNPFFEHATVQLVLAFRGDRPVGRISAHIDRLALAQPMEKGMGPGTGNWGMMEAADAEVMAALLEAAEHWLRDRGMHRSLGPLSLSIWDEPGLLTKSDGKSPMIMMGHHKAEYEGWIAGAGYREAKQLYTYTVPVEHGFPKLIQRIVQSGRRNDKIALRPIDMKHFDRDATIMLGLLNDAWSENWGFVPLTDSEIDYVKKKLKPAIIPRINLVAEYEGEAVGFMLCLPDINEVVKDLDGSLWPFGWARLFYRLKRKNWHGGRVPIMGVAKKHQHSRLASQLAFMMIETIRQRGVEDYGFVRAEVGWVLDDNRGMLAVADAIDAEVTRVYAIYEKGL